MTHGPSTEPFYDKNNGLMSHVIKPLWCIRVLHGFDLLSKAGVLQLTRIPKVKGQ